MRERFSRGGIGSFSEHEILEMLLYAVYRQGDVNPIAHSLINQFGSLRHVLDADYEQLVMVHGVARSTALYIRFIKDIIEYYGKASNRSPSRTLENITMCADYTRGLFENCAVEKFYVIYLDPKKEIIGEELIGEGGFNHVAVDYGSVTRKAYARNAAYVVMTHNHPGGAPNPSDQDLMLTNQIKRQLDALGITLLDHIIITGQGRFCSMSYEGFLND